MVKNSKVTLTPLRIKYGIDRRYWIHGDWFENVPERMKLVHPNHDKSGFNHQAPMYSDECWREMDRGEQTIAMLDNVKMKLALTFNACLDGRMASKSDAKSAYTRIANLLKTSLQGFGGLADNSRYFIYTDSVKSEEIEKLTTTANDDKIKSQTAIEQLQKEKAELQEKLTKEQNKVAAHEKDAIARVISFERNRHNLKTEVDELAKINAELQNKLVQQKVALQKEIEAHDKFAAIQTIQLAQLQKEKIELQGKLAKAQQEVALLKKGGVTRDKVAAIQIQQLKEKIKTRPNLQTTGSQTLPKPATYRQALTKVVSFESNL